MFQVVFCISSTYYGTHYMKVFFVVYTQKLRVTLHAIRRNKFNHYDTCLHLLGFFVVGEFKFPEMGESHSCALNFQNSNIFTVCNGEIGQDFSDWLHFWNTAHVNGNSSSVLVVYRALHFLQCT